MTTGKAIFTNVNGKHILLAKHIGNTLIRAGLVRVVGRRNYCGILYAK